MKISRRDLFKSATLASRSVIANSLFEKPKFGRGLELQDPKQALPPTFDKLKPLGDRVKPITAAEFQARSTCAGVDE
jgi:hypothetical protein